MDTRIIIATVAVLVAVGLALVLPRAQTSTTMNPPSTVGTTQTLTAQSVAMHASADDCWTIVEGKTYDVTPFISEHPGGRQEISRACGIDATALFTSNVGRVHSQSAHQILSQFYIGDVGDQVQASVNSPATQTSATAVKSEHDDEYEEDDD